MWKPFLLLVLMILIGTAGYQYIEGWSLLDSFYMTIITIFTVGFKEVKALSPQGQLFTVFVILGGVGVALFSFTRVAEMVYEGGINKFWRRRKMERKLQSIKNHYIICGHGRMGKVVRARLQEEKLPFVVIDRDEKKLAELKESGECLLIKGDATAEEILIQAGLKNAKALAALLSTDADNLYLVLTARLINPSIFILSKALDEEAERKILQVGANKAVSPYKLSGLKIAQGLIRPTLVDFMDLIISRKELPLYMEEFVVKKESKIVDSNLRESDIRKTTNVIVVAVKKPGEDIVFNPSPEIKIETDDILLVLGDEQGIAKFENVYISHSS